MTLQECFETIAGLRTASSFCLRVEHWQHVYPAKTLEEANSPPLRSYITSFAFFDTATRQLIVAPSPDELCRQVLHYLTSTEYQSWLNTPVAAHLREDFRLPEAKPRDNS